jgi:acylphosphatase
MDAETSVRLVVVGLVQGVGFRYAARQAAEECGVVGWVRNLPDGSVEIVAQGTPAAVARMTSWAERGPRHASVERVRVDPLRATAGLAGFEIRR